MKLFLASLLLVAAVSATEYQDCGSHATDITFEVEGCDIPPCVVERGSNYPAFIRFTPDHDISFLNATVTASIGGIEVPWPGFNTDGCSSLAEGQSCPILAGTSTTWEYIVEVLPEYPTISTLATFLLSDIDHVETCLQAPVTIV